MSFWPCPDQDDPFTKVVRERYQANVVKGPRTGIDPLDILAKAYDRDAVENRGSLRNLIEGVDWPEIQDDQAADLSGTRSVDVDASLAMDLTGKFLKALGVPIPDAGVDANLWRGASKFSFEVHDVNVHSFDIGSLGNSIEGHEIPQTGATRIFFDGLAKLFLISHTLTSPKFAVKGSSERGQSVEANVSAIKDLIGEAEAKVSWKLETEDTISFEGTEALTFAVSVISTGVTQDGRLFLGNSKDDVRYLDNTPQAHPLYDEAGLLELDEGSAVAAQ